MPIWAIQKRIITPEKAAFVSSFADCNELFVINQRFPYYITPRRKGKAVLREVVKARDLCYAIIIKKWRQTHGLSGAVPPLPSGAV